MQQSHCNLVAVLTEHLVRSLSPQFICAGAHFLKTLGFPQVVQNENHGSQANRRERFRRLTGVDGGDYGVNIVWSAYLLLGIVAAAFLL